MALGFKVKTKIKLCGRVVIGKVGDRQDFNRIRKVKAQPFDNWHFAEWAAELSEYER